MSEPFLDPEHRSSRNDPKGAVETTLTEFRYEREVQPLPRIGPWREELDRLLSQNAAKPARERLTSMRIFEEIRALGFEGGYDAIRRYAKGWKKERGAVTAEAFVPLVFAPVRSPESNGMAEAFVKTLRRDYARTVILPDAQTVLALLPAWIDDYNTSHPYSGLGFRSPREFRALPECA